MILLKRKWFLLSVLLLLIKLILSTESYSSDFNFPRDSKYNVVLLKSNTSAIGTGFWYASDKWMYIITAKHVLSNIDNLQFSSYIKGYKEDMPDEYAIDLTTATVKSNIIRSDSRDIVAIRIGRITSDFQPVEGVTFTPPRFQNISSQPQENRTTICAPINRHHDFDDIDCVEDIVFFGFPSSISRYAGLFHTNQLDPNSPLFRKGVIAGKNTKNRTFIIDGAVYWGNSGSPVVLVSHDNIFPEKFSVIGVIKELIQYISISKNEANQLTNINSENTGYAVVEPIDTIIKLIEENEKYYK